MTKDDEFPAIPGYVPIKEAAKLLGISNPRMYGYVREKRIPARKAGRSLMIPLEELEHFKLNPPGRVRTKAADWRVYNSRSKLLGMDIHVQTLPGQQGRLLEKLKLIYRKQQHKFPGTIQRYILKDDISLSAISIWLVWKDTEMPDKEAWERELTAFKAELADVLNWETAQISIKEGIIYT
jgi:excisionase family DNA binding protein